MNGLSSKETQVIMKYSHLIDKKMQDARGPRWYCPGSKWKGHVGQDKLTAGICPLNKGE